MNAKWIETTEGQHRFMYEGNNALLIFVNDKGVTQVRISCGKTSLIFDFEGADVYWTGLSLDEPAYGNVGIVYAGIFNDSDKDWLIARTLEYCVSGDPFDISVVMSRNISLIAKPLSKTDIKEGVEDLRYSTDLLKGGLK